MRISGLADRYTEGLIYCDTEYVLVPMVSWNMMKPFCVQQPAVHQVSEVRFSKLVMWPKYKQFRWPCAGFTGTENSRSARVQRTAFHSRLWVSLQCALWFNKYQTWLNMQIWSVIRPWFYDVLFLTLLAAHTYFVQEIAPQLFGRTRWQKKQ